MPLSAIHPEHKNSIPLGGVGYKHVGYRADKLSVLDYTLIGESALCAFGAAHRVCLTANRRGAICGICPDKQASRYECS